MARIAICAVALPLLLSACGGPPRREPASGIERAGPESSASAPAACANATVQGSARLQIPPGSDPVEAWNDWSYQQGLQHDLRSMLALAVPDAFPADVSIRIAYESGEQPEAATATVVHEGLLDDSIRGERFELRFRRVECPSCSNGPPRWMLSSWARAWSCWEGRGHADFTTEPCI